MIIPIFILFPFLEFIRAPTSSYCAPFRTPTASSST